MSEPKEKKQKTGGHKVYAAIVLTLAIAIIATTIYLVFHVQKIEISGNEYVVSEEIAKSVQSDKFSTNTLYIWAKNALGKIDYPKSVESAKVKFKAPWSIEVQVKEKKVIGYIIFGDEYVYFDEDGIVISKAPILKEGVPHLEGISVSEVKVNEKLPVEEERLFRNVMEASESFSARSIAPERIIGKGAELTVMIGGVCVELGSGDMELKISQLPPILEKLAGKSGTLDLRYYNETTEIISFKEGEMPKLDGE